jgi:2-phosphosulfolactate phosphatase
MNVDVLFLPGEFPARPRPQRRAVVVDVIRATTTIVTAFQAGARAVVPVSGPEEARSVRARHPGAILAGERGGRRIPGFALGNSPRDFTRDAVADKDIILSTSNGTKTLRAVGEGRRVAIAAFLNRAAVARWIAASPEDSLIVCSGYEGAFSLEDAVCAGAVVERTLSLDASPTLGDGASACLVLWKNFARNLSTVVRESGWGRRVVQLGLGADLDICSRLDVADVLPVMFEGRIVLEPWSHPPDGPER